MDTTIDTLTREMSPEESLEAEKDSFRLLAATEAPITRSRLKEGWEIYRSFAMVRKEISRENRTPSRVTLPSSEDFSCALAMKRYAILNGEDPGFNEKDITAATSIFHLDTIGMHSVGGELGALLKGMNGEDLARAENFCRSMNKVGLKKDDIDAFPEE